MYNEGISASGDLLDTGTLMGIIKKSGNTYLFDDVKLGVGRENAKQFIKENSKVAKDIDQTIREKVKAGEVVPAKLTEQAEGGEE